MFLLDYFYGTKKTKPCEQGQEDDWVLVDNNELTLSTSTISDDHGLLENSIDQLQPEPKSIIKGGINYPSSQSETEELRNVEDVIEDIAQVDVERIEVQIPVGGRIGQLRSKIVQPLNQNNTNLNLVKADSVKLKNNCKKQPQRRSEKYKNGVWSGRNNDRKCGKCY